MRVSRRVSGCNGVIADAPGRNSSRELVVVVMAQQNRNRNLESGAGTKVTNFRPSGVQEGAN